MTNRQSDVIKAARLLVEISPRGDDAVIFWSRLEMLEDAVKAAGVEPQGQAAAPGLAEGEMISKGLQREKLARWKKKRKQARKWIAEEAEAVMEMLFEHRERAVPHLIDSDDNSGECLRHWIRKHAKAEIKIREILARSGGEG